MHCAIQLQKIDLGEGRVVFKPIGLIKGDFLEQDEFFVDEYGYQYFFMKDSNPDCDRYFCCPATIEQLRKAYGEQLKDIELLEEFLASYLECCFLGYYDIVNEITKVIEVNFIDLENMIASKELGLEEDLKEDYIEFDSDNNERFIFSLKTLKEIRDCQTVEEIRDYIDKLIAAGEYIKENGLSEKTGESEEKESKLVLKKEESNKFNLAKLRKEVLTSIVGQDDAVWDLTRTIAVNQTSNNYRNKSHILISGPSGTGKTEMVNVIAKELDLPIFKANAPEYTKSGYQGKDVPSLLLGLITAANGDVQKAQNGILILDEIDKIVTFQDDKGFGKAVLHELLKIFDRDVIEVDVDKSRGSKIMFDTSNLTIICMGSFEELYERKQQVKPKSIGFGAVVGEEPKIITRLDEDDFIGWMGPEFVGRVGVFTETSALSEKAVLKILKESKLSQFLIAQQDFESRGIKLHATTSYLIEIAKRGYSKKLGVRKLNKEVKKSLKYVYDEVLTNPKIKTIKLTKKTVEDPKEYCVEY